MEPKTPAQKAKQPPLLIAGDHIIVINGGFVLVDGRFVSGAFRLQLKGENVTLEIGYGCVDILK